MVGRFRAVLFDMGGTVVRNEDPARVFMKIFEASGVCAQYEDVARVHAACQLEMDTVEMAKMGREYWVQWNLKMLRRLGLTGDLEPLAREIDADWFKYAEVEPYPDAVETLHRLRALGVKTGIVTNGLRRDYETVLTKTSLRDLFDTVVGADDCHAAKPDKRIFRHALKKLNVRPEEAIFIGDSRQYDYEGAKQAGLKPLLLNRSGSRDAESATITDLTEVLNHLAPSRVTTQ